MRHEWEAGELILPALISTRALKRAICCSLSLRPHMSWAKSNTAAIKSPQAARKDTRELWQTTTFMQWSAFVLQVWSACREVLTQRLEDFSSCKFPIEEDSVVVCVEEPTHPDQNNFHGACVSERRMRQERFKIQFRLRWKLTGLFLEVTGSLTCLEKCDLVILAEHAKAWDVFCEFHHVLHGIGQSNGTVLPHLIHWLRVGQRKGSWRGKGRW